MKFQIGQSVNFTTRNSSPEGISGEGVIIEVHPDIANKYIVLETYTVEAGPYQGQEINRRVMCLESELESGQPATVEINGKQYQTITT